VCRLIGQLSLSEDNKRTVQPVSACKFSRHEFFPLDSVAVKLKLHKKFI